MNPEAAEWVPEMRIADLDNFCERTGIRAYHAGWLPIPNGDRALVFPEAMRFIKSEKRGDRDRNSTGVWAYRVRNTTTGYTIIL